MAWRRDHRRVPAAARSARPFGGRRAGWLIAGAIVAFACAYAARLQRWSGAVSANEILGLNYVGIALTATLMWLNGESSPYTELLLLATLYTAAVHPPRRTLPFLGVVALALASPLIYGAGDPLADGLARFLIWGGLALVATTYTARVRLQRASLVEMGKEARSQARLDPLTTLGNRRAFDEALAAGIARSGRTGSPLSVILADLDSFKAINDDFGLPAGDRCLCEVAAVLRDAVRTPDSCYRWGGDEFVVVADVDRSGADLLAARLTDAVAERCRRPEGTPVLLHTGTAELGRQGADAAELLTMASRALKPADASPG